MDRFLGRGRGIQAGSHAIERLPRTAPATNGRWTWVKRAFILPIPPEYGLRHCSSTYMRLPSVGNDRAASSGNIAHAESG